MSTKLSPANAGSLAELRVSVHLISMGFQVFRNVLVNGPTDLLAIRGRSRRIIRVQVKSTLGMAQLKNLRNGGNELLAVIVDGQIHYRAIDRSVQKLIPGSILARRPRKSHKSATKKPTKTS